MLGQALEIGVTNLSLQGWEATKSGTARVSGALVMLVGEHLSAVW